ncbi:MAG: hypothetical protein ACREMW_12470 [Gemmatimonadales bacterium]
MRRSIVPMLTLCAALSTPLAGQSALSVGYAGTLGGHWQIEALDLGVSHPLGLGPVRHVGLAVRLGWFGDQGAIIGGTRGFLGALGLALRSGGLNLAAVGDDVSPTVIGVDLTLEAAGYLASRSPLPEGRRWLSLALLPGLRVGQLGRPQFAVLVGPAWFAGDVRRTHPFVSARVDFPLARRRGGP